ncbi:hypothetical protein DEJ50_25715 [Streptomyces venezuelae]|uniref:Uncharacterized protein n=1 Tax=Streptomyces venezuelae TaxID=54571 RepID=A0A5P2D9H6_STRVZ|nr:hypothetical protein [Streptomyces venezuelae]QES50728.1 hypothetical protein DEJ50_25715 [Streptomyces venezuelae]
MFPSLSLAQDIGLAILVGAVLVGIVGLGHLRRNRRSHPAEPAAFEGPSVIPAQRTSSAHPMESVELTEAEKEAFAGLIRAFPQR